MKRLLILAMIATFIVAIFTITSCECEHEFGDWEVKKEATCTENGSRTRICIKCNKFTQEIETLAKGHNFNNQVVNASYFKQESTCKQSAQYYYSCQCGEKGTDAFEFGIVGDHEYIYVPLRNGIHQKVCKYDEEDVVIQNCTGEEPNCDMRAVCESCNAEYGSVKEHQYELQEVIKEASCSEEGKELYKCTCGATEERALKKIPHDFTKSAFTIEPDCGKKQNGVRQNICSVCGTADSYGKVELIQWTHDYEEVRVEATCQSPGVVTLTCKSCKATGKTTIINQLPHQEKIIEQHAATCENDGYNRCECTVCGEIWNIVTEGALGHDFSTELHYKEATDTSDGYYYYPCTRCDEEYVA